MTKTVFRVLGLVASLAVGGAASAADAPAIQWKVSDGGNGHWYQFFSATVNWDVARANALAKGGDLVCITTLSENNFVKILLPIGSAGYMGAVHTTEGVSGFEWVSGEPWSFTSWNNYEPNGGVGQIVWIENAGGWNDHTKSNPTVSSIVEYSADCNGDGVVDYGQIQSGELADTNHNNIPDVCELMITSVQPISGASTGGTAVRINGNNFPSSPIVTFGGVAATDIVRVTPSLITAVTPAGTPGMTVVAVNSASSESFYYRPSCDGDLDNNGTIDSSDLGLMLVNYGNCYESAVPEPQEQEPFILQSLETPNPVLNKK